MSQLLIDLSTTGPKGLLDLNSYGSASVQSQVVVGSSWNGGIISIQVSNTQHGALYDLATPKTISADGLTTLTAADWQPYRYLWLVCSTAASSRTLVELDITTKD